LNDIFYRWYKDELFNRNVSGQGEAQSRKTKMSKCVAYLKLFLPPNTVIEAMPSDDRALQLWDQELRRISVSVSDLAMTYLKAEAAKKNNSGKKNRMTDSFFASYLRFQNIPREELDEMINACSVQDKAAREPFNSIRFILDA
jgi:hypothetical protein